MENACQRIDMITSELQEAIMKTRMQAVGNVFSKFPRVVRDLARTLGKEIELKVEGQEVELDKTIIEGIGDPLTHLVRNSVDHGIEAPDVRRKAGKNTTGRVELRAFHEAGQVNIEIRDDGKGLDGNMLAESAIRKGLLTEDQAAAMSDKEKMNLIFMPGFSTAKEVTDVSGRGVGMDVVKTNLDKLGGVVEIESEIGFGTNIRIKLPLTLAIIPSQLVSAGGERYAIPQVNMEELLRIPAGQVKERVEKVGDAEVVRLRGKLLPLIKLADVIGIESTYINPEDGLKMPDRRQNIANRRSKKSPEYSVTGHDETVDHNHQAIPRASRDRRYHADSALNIVVVSTGTMKYGLVVDSLHDSEEIVVKPLGRHLKHCKGYAGATIMGDGRVALILDVAGLSRMAGLNSVEGTERASEAHEEESQTGKDIQSLLMFRNAEDEQFSVPLGLVSRIEKIKRDAIEEVGGKRVMQYREMSLPLSSIEDVAAVKPVADTENLLVIVFTIAGKEMGLLAVSPVDAVDVAAAFDDRTLKQTGIMGSAIIDGCTTQMVDIFELVETMHPEWFEEREVVQTEAGESATILYAEDSNFFRTQVKSFMKDEGYNVVEAEDGEIAWNLLCERGEEIDLVVTDIEMPNMNGFEFAKKIKEDERFKHLSVIAMTTLAGEEDIAKGRENGIDNYQIKLDKEQLLESIHNCLSK
jgi:two-component system chemotaxis sensor kinase CheA